jgi:hypothetical protein
MNVISKDVISKVFKSIVVLPKRNVIELFLRHQPMFVIKVRAYPSGAILTGA